MSAPIQRPITIVNRLGLHARAAAKFVTLAEQFPAEIQVERGGQSVDARSIMGLMMLGAAKGETITLIAPDETALPALDALTALVENGFGEHD